MQTVSQSWLNAQGLKILPVSDLQISYGQIDNDAQDDAEASSTLADALSNTTAITNTASFVGNDYATLERNQWELDGEEPIYSPSNNVGFISSNVSNNDGTFTNHPVITLNFDTVHATSVSGLRIQWSKTMDEYPTSFKITAYNASSQVIGTAVTVTGNTSISTFTAYTITNYKKIEIEIISWSISGAKARIEQVILGDYKIFPKEEIMGFEHIEKVDLLSFSLPKAQITFKLNNKNEQWNPDNPTGAYQYLSTRQKLTVKYGYIIHGVHEYIDCGTFYMSEWDTPQNGITVTFTARDLIEYMGKTFVTTYPLTTNLKALAETAFTQCGINSNQYSIDNSLASISTTLTTDVGYSCAELVQLCANAGCCVMYQDRQGVMRIEPLNTSAPEQPYTINRFVSYDNAEYEQSRVLAGVDVNDGLGTYSTGNSGEIQTIQNPLIVTAQRANAVAQWVAGVLSNRKTLSGDFRADIRLDALDKIKVENKYSQGANALNVYITEIKYTYNGGFKGNYEGRIV